MASQIYEEIMWLPYNKQKVQKFMDLGLNPRYGLSAEITQLMIDLYVEVSGDTSMTAKYNCGACQDYAYRRLQDFLTYDDDMGRELKNWLEPVVEKKKKK